MRFLPSFKCCIGKTGIELDLLSEISSILAGLHSEIFKWQQPSKHNFYQVFLHFLIWHPSNGVCCISCPSAALIQSYFCNTPNWQWIEDRLFPGFFAVFSWTWIENCHQISLQESLETPWNTTLATWISSIWTTGGWDAEFASSIWKIGGSSTIFESFSIYTTYLQHILMDFILSRSLAVIQNSHCYHMNWLPLAWSLQIFVHPLLASSRMGLSKSVNLAKINSKGVAFLYLCM